jgi:hypothetical protein
MAERHFEKCPEPGRSRKKATFCVARINITVVSANSLPNIFVPNGATVESRSCEVGTFRKVHALLKGSSLGVVIRL